MFRLFRFCVYSPPRRQCFGKGEECANPLARWRFLDLHRGPFGPRRVRNERRSGMCGTGTLNLLCSGKCGTGRLGLLWDLQRRWSVRCGIQSGEKVINVVGHIDCKVGEDLFLGTRRVPPYSDASGILLDSYKLLYWIDHGRLEQGRRSQRRRRRRESGRNRRVGFCLQNRSAREERKNILWARRHIHPAARAVAGRYTSPRRLEKLYEIQIRP